jgi:acetyltransferase-like isoleucine patch superfamily enzyme
MLRRAVLCLLMCIPCVLRIPCYRRLFGWRIGRRVRIGFSYIDCTELEIGDEVWIGHLNNFRSTRKLTIGKGCFISNLNQISGSGTHYSDFPCTVAIGENAHIMSRHFIDSSGTIRIARDVTLAGRDTHIWSHTRVISNGQPQLAPTEVVIGPGSYIGARSTLVGCRLPARAVVGAGSVVTKDFSDISDQVLIAGNPAKVVKTYPTEAVSESA